MKHSTRLKLRIRRLTTAGALSAALKLGNTPPPPPAEIPRLTRARKGKISYRPRRPS